MALVLINQGIGNISLGVDVILIVWTKQSNRKKKETNVRMYLGDLISHYCAISLRSPVRVDARLDFASTRSGAPRQPRNLQAQNLKNR